VGEMRVGEMGRPLVGYKLHLLRMSLHRWHQG